MEDPEGSGRVQETSEDPERHVILEDGMVEHHGTLRDPMVERHVQATVQTHDLRDEATAPTPRPEAKQRQHREEEEQEWLDYLEIEASMDLHDFPPEPLVENQAEEEKTPSQEDNTDEQVWLDYLRAAFPARKDNAKYARMLAKIAAYQATIPEGFEPVPHWCPSTYPNGARKYSEYSKYRSRYSKRDCECQLGFRPVNTEDQWWLEETRDGGDYD